MADGNRDQVPGSCSLVKKRKSAACMTTGLNAKGRYSEHRKECEGEESLQEQVGAWSEMKLMQSNDRNKSETRMTASVLK